MRSLHTAKVKILPSLAVKFVLCNWFVLTDILLANGEELNIILSKFARPVYFFSHHLFGT